MATTVTLKPNAIDISGSTSGTTTLQATAVAGTTTLTLPAATDTLVGKATTDTLTNKTLTGAVMNGTLGATTPSTVAATSISYTTTLTGGTGIVAIGTNQIYKDASGNVGIGTSSVTGKLNVIGTAAGVSAYFSDAVNSSFAIRNAAGGVVLGTDSGGVLRFATNGNATTDEKMRIDSSGNVGIGTTAAGGTLNVLSNSGSAVGIDVLGRSSDNLGTIRLLSNNAGTNYGSFRASASSVDLMAVANVPLTFYTNNAEKMRIDSSGNVGIGTTANASAILDAQSTTKGVRFPNMTTTQKNAISSPAAGLVVFDTTLSKLAVYSGAAWQTITSV
jgi:hypothetical protein